MQIAQSDDQLLAEESTFERKPENAKQAWFKRGGAGLDWAWDLGRMNR